MFYSYQGLRLDNEINFSNSIIDDSKFINYINNYTSKLPPKISNKKELTEKLKDFDKKDKIIATKIQVTRIVINNKVWLN
jgi:hypothetical protein